jgi:hypothetical protein
MFLNMIINPDNSLLPLTIMAIRLNPHNITLPPLSIIDLVYFVCIGIEKIFGFHYVV